MIRKAVRASIRAFVAAQDYAGKHVLDFGCGEAPYRSIVESAGGKWTGYNRGYFPGGSTDDIGPAEPLEQSWDVILCNQVLQYVPNPASLLADFRRALSPGGVLVMTYAVNWPEVESEDLFRFTRGGMETLLSGWQIVDHVRLSGMPFEGSEIMPLDNGVVARA